MATCYRCGSPIPSIDFKFRRKVKTGERISRRYPNPNVSAIHVTWGIRLVCSPCARAIDLEALLARPHVRVVQSRLRPNLPEG